jgi:dCTP deaminase
MLTKNDISKRLNSGENNQIFIDPILDQKQIGAVSIDMRLGCDFLVSVLSRKPSIKIVKEDGFRDPAIHFQESRRDIGETFILYPSQIALTTTLEYVGLPQDIYADIVTRSSYNRLGISLGTMFQPGFRGCMSLELFNHSSSPIELVVGSRIVQARFHQLTEGYDYYGDGPRRKYIGHVRPTTSRASEDFDLPKLQRIGSKRYPT